MISAWLHPGLLVIAAGFALVVLRGNLRAAVAVAAPAAAAWLVLAAPEGAVWSVSWLGLEVVPYAVDRLSRLFALVFALMASAGALYALGQRSRLELPAAFVYAGASIGAVLAGDLLTLFVCWELMAVASTLVIWSAGRDPAYRAAKRYLAIHLLGGVLLFVGIAGHYAATGSLAFARLDLSAPAQWLILAGFLVNAAAPPLSAWLPDAYPQASWSGTVFLSAFTTKTAVYALVRGFPGTELLVWIGLFMVFYGIVMALLENDMRRILAYSIVNQVGFMMVGVGIGTELALNGVAAHAFVHIIYKGLLLMSAGAVLYATGRSRCSELGGLYRAMPLTAAFGVIGALAASSFPLTSGFVSKAMISQSAAGLHDPWIWLLLAAASVGVFLHAGATFLWFVFFQKKQDPALQAAEPPANMRAAMLLLALLCIGIGVFYEPLYALLPYGDTYVPYTGAHVLVQLQLLLFAGLAFFLLLPMLRRTRTVTLDADWLYRRLAPALLGGVEAGWRLGVIAVRAPALALARSIGARIRSVHGVRGALARTASTGGMTMWVAVLLAAYLIVYYL